jgi:hypothetical protein
MAEPASEKTRDPTFGRIALVQNQSEMRHNAFADARPLFKELGFDTGLFTAGNIERLADRVQRLEYDAVVLGSNALNDRTILAAVRARQFRAALDFFLKSGRGFACFHQMSLARSGDALGVLPSPWDEASLHREQRKTTIAFPPGGERHPVMKYPHVVEPARIEADAQRFTPLGRLWFGWWEGVRRDAWAVVLTDGGPPEQDERVLVAVAQDPGASRRVALCALPADWQRATGLLPNLLHYVCRGSTPTAVVRPKSRDRNLDLVTRFLDAERIVYESYRASELDGLARRIGDGVHETLLLGPGVGDNDLGPAVGTAIDAGVEAGTLRVLGFQPGRNERLSLWISSARLGVADVFPPLVAQMVAELNDDDAYIDRSFWATVESLKTLRNMGSAAPIVPDRTLVAPAVRKAKRTMESSGSYDDTAAATCGLLWLLETFAEESPSTATWLLTFAADNHETFPIEALAALTARREAGYQVEQDAVLMKRLLGEIDPGEEVSHLLTALEAARIDGDRTRELSWAEALIRRQRDGAWTDLETTAAAVEQLMALDRAQLTAELCTRLDDAVLAASVYIRESADLEKEAPWAGRVSTSLMCIRALHLANRIADIPVSETITALGRGSRSQQAAGMAAVRVGEEMRRDNQRLRDRTEALEREKGAVEERLSAVQREYAEAVQAREHQEVRLKTWLLWLGAAIVYLLYLWGALAASGAATGGIGGLLERFASHFSDHVAVLAVVVASGFALDQVRRPPDRRIIRSRR